MYLEETNQVTNNKKILLNNLNDFIIQIDYFDQKGIKKRKHRVPLKYLVNPKFINSQSSI
jgi:5-carboxymethyl-2-hydroxymuconate isomerase